MATAIDRFGASLLLWDGLPCFMALFARRRVQEAIGRCATFMPRADLGRKVAELNARNDSSLPAEWEIMVAAAVSGVCPVAYEPDLGGKRRGDLLMMPNGMGTPGCLVEIVTVSDEHAHHQNPYESVCSAIHAKLRKLKLPKGGCDIQVGSKREGEYGDAKLQLLLGKGHHNGLFDDAFYAFVRAAKENPNDRHVHSWKGDHLDITLTFDPNTDPAYASGGHLVYTVVHSRTRNPVYNALKAKSKQLAETGHPGPFGVIICDGGCDVLSNKLNSGTSFSLKDIVQEYFAKSSRLAFALVLHVETEVSTWPGPMRICQRLGGQMFARDGLSALAGETIRRLAAIDRSLLVPLDSPSNAVRRYRSKLGPERWGFADGTISVTHNKVRLSARAVLEMLSGHTTPAAYFSGFPPVGTGPRNDFERLRRQGRLIIGLEFVKGAKDDDEIEFTFGPPDAAASPFRIVSSNPNDSGVNE